MRLLYFLVIIILLTPSSQAEEWERHESEHFIFYYSSHHLDVHEITLIASHQEDLYSHITDILDIEFHEKITYYLYGNREDYGSTPGAYAMGTEIRFLCIFCVDMCKNGLNDAHEMTHALSTVIGNQHGLLSEGLAVYVEDHYIGGENLHSIVKILHNQGELTPPSDLLGDFWCDICFNYDIAGSFATFLIETYGMDRFKELYAHEPGWDSFNAVYGKSLTELEAQWIAVVEEVKITQRDIDTVRYRNRIREGLSIYFNLGFLRVNHGTYPARAEEGICLFREHYDENSEEAFSYLSQFHEGMQAWKTAIVLYKQALEEHQYHIKAELFGEAAQQYRIAGDEVMRVSAEENAMLFETLAEVHRQLLHKEFSSVESQLEDIESLVKKYDMEEDVALIKQQMGDISEQNYQGFEVGILLIFFCIIGFRYLRRIEF
jgi:hypothetical protein